MDYRTPGFLVLQYLLEFAQIHIHWVDDAIQPYNPPPPSSLFAFNFPASGTFPLHGLFVPSGWSIGASASVKILPVNIQGWFPSGIGSPYSVRDDWLVQGILKMFFIPTIQKHQIFGTLPPLWTSSHIHTRLLEKIMALNIWTFVGKVMSLHFNVHCLGLS